MKILKHIPNFITSLNILSGCVGIGFLFSGEILIAAYFIGIAAIFDFLDGFAAKLLKVKSEFGKELDSLADVVSFGVLPGLIMFSLLKMCFEDTGGWQHYLPFFAFLIPVFSALRLAKFNLDIRQTVNFIGLPTPANALFIASIPFIISSDSGEEGSFISNLFGNPGFLFILVFIMSFLLVSNLPLFSMKFKNFKWEGNSFRYIFLAMTLILIALFHFAAVPFLLILYIILSVIQNSSKHEIPR
jgi:CDP-diacylglycerol---serine O-phosphatidyltransferase